MSTDYEDSVWTKKGATLSDKSARDELGLTQEEILQAMREGKLQYRHNVMHGNPYWRLIRSEVEAYVIEKSGQDHLIRKKSENELKQINRELKKLKAQVTSLEQRKAELLALLSGPDRSDPASADDVQ